MKGRGHLRDHLPTGQGSQDEDVESYDHLAHRVLLLFVILYGAWAEWGSA